MACSCNQSMSLRGSSESQQYPQFPATDFDPMGAYEPPVRMNSKATKFLGYQKDGSPIFVENLSSKAYLGNLKDGTPVFINASDPYAINYTNMAATAILAGTGVALGWLLAKATLSYLK